VDSEAEVAAWETLPRTCVWTTSTHTNTSTVHRRAMACTHIPVRLSTAGYSALNAYPCGCGLAACRYGVSRRVVPRRRRRTSLVDVRLIFADTPAAETRPRPPLPLLAMCVPTVCTNPSVHIRTVRPTPCVCTRGRVRRAYDGAIRSSPFITRAATTHHHILTCIPVSSTVRGQRRVRCGWGSQRSATRC
jgi:hypothetical protein